MQGTRHENYFGCQIVRQLARPNWNGDTNCWLPTQQRCENVKGLVADPNNHKEGKTYESLSIAEKVKKKCAKS